MLACTGAMKKTKPKGDSAMPPNNAFHTGINRATNNNSNNNNNNNRNNNNNNNNNNRNNNTETDEVDALLYSTLNNRFNKI